MSVLTPITAASGFIFPTKILSNAFMENHFIFAGFYLASVITLSFGALAINDARRGRFVHVPVRNNHEVVL